MQKTVESDQNSTVGDCVEITSKLKTDGDCVSCGNAKGLRNNNNHEKYQKLNCRRLWESHQTQLSEKSHQNSRRRCWRLCRVTSKLKLCRVTSKLNCRRLCRVTSKLKDCVESHQNSIESLRFRGRAQSRWRRKSEKPGWSAGWTKETRTVARKNLRVL